MKSAVLIPSFCPDQNIITLVSALLQEDFSAVLVVNDGSGERYSPIFETLKQLGCQVVAHKENRGKGAALKTGIAALTQRVPNLDVIVTADGDGQHAPDDICRVARSALQHPNSLILGTRDFHGAHVPPKSRYGNRFSSIYFKLSTHISCPDTQTGLRGIPSCLFPLSRSVSGERYEYEMAFLMDAAKQKYPISFVPIQTIYENNNAGSHFRPLADAILIYKTPLKFACASLFSAVVDLSLFTVLSSIPLGNTWFRVFFATVLARTISGTVNFLINRAWSFESRHAAGMQAVKYAALFVVQMLMSWMLVSALSIAPINLTFLKVLVDGTLFVFSYFAQLNWVFSPHVNHRSRI